MSRRLIDAFNNTKTTTLIFNSSRDSTSPGAVSTRNWVIAQPIAHAVVRHIKTPLRHTTRDRRHPSRRHHLKRSKKQLISKCHLHSTTGAQRRPLLDLDSANRRGPGLLVLSRIGGASRGLVRMSNLGERASDHTDARGVC